MADKPAEFDWSEVTGHVAERLRKPKVKPCPEPIVRQAQRSYEGVERVEHKDGLDRKGRPVKDTDGKPILDNVLEFEFDSEAKATSFAEHMRNAGNHTVPQTSVSVLQDPEDNGNKKLVRWRAGERRGRAAS